MATHHIIDDDFAVFDSIEFHEENVNFNSNNDINLPSTFDGFPSQSATSPYSKTQWTLDGHQKQASTGTSQNSPQQRSSQVRFSFHNDDGSGAADTVPSLDDIDDIVSGSGAMGMGIKPLDGGIEEIILSSDDFFGTETPQTSMIPIDTDAMNGFGEDPFGQGPDSDLKPIGADDDDKLRDYYHFLASQINNNDQNDGQGGSNNNQEYHSDEEDAEWIEHDRHNLNHIVFQADESVKIKTKESKLGLKLKQNDSQNGANIDGTTTITSTNPEANTLKVAKPLLAMPYDIATMVNDKSSTTKTSPATATTTKRPLLAMPDDIAALVKTSTSPLTTLQIDLLMNGNDGQNGPNDPKRAKSDDDASTSLPTRVVRASQCQLITSGSNQIKLDEFGLPMQQELNEFGQKWSPNDQNDQNEDFAANFHEGFMDSAELALYQEKIRTLQRLHLESQRQRLSKVAITDPVLLQQQQESFLSKMSKMETNHDQMIKENPLIGLGIHNLQTKEHLGVGTKSVNGGGDGNDEKNGQNNIKMEDFLDVENEPLCILTNDEEENGNGEEHDDNDQLNL